MTSSIPSCPGFGEIIPASKIKLDNDFAKKIYALAIAIFIGVLGTMFGSALMGAALMSCALFAFVFIDKIIERFWSYHYQLNNTIATPTLEGAPKLGETSQANIMILGDVGKSLEWKKKLIDCAEQSIEVSFNYAGGRYFCDVLDRIEKRLQAKPHLRVHILVTLDLLESREQTKLKELQKTYGERFVYLVSDRVICLRPTLHSEENHAKILVVDGKYFVIGGSGVHPFMSRETPPDKFEYPKTLGAAVLDQASHDSDLVGEGILAETIRTQFFALFQKWERRMNNVSKTRYFPLNSNEGKGKCAEFDSNNVRVFHNVNVKCLVCGPEHYLNNPITQELVERIKKATRRILFANLVFNPNRPITRALTEQKKQQPDLQVEGCFNGTENNMSINHYVVVLPSRYHYTLFDKVFEYRQKEVLFHKKVTIIDDNYLMIGSYNLGEKSGNWDDEMVLVVDSNEVALSVSAMIKSDMVKSKEVKYKKWLRNLSWPFSKCCMTIVGPFFG